MRRSKEVSKEGVAMVSIFEVYGVLLLYIMV